MHPGASWRSLFPMIVILWQAGLFEELDWLVPLYADRIPSEVLHNFRIHLDEVEHYSHKAANSVSQCWREVHLGLQGDSRKLDLPELDNLDLDLAEAHEEAADSPEL